MKIDLEPTDIGPQTLDELKEWGKNYGLFIFGMPLGREQYVAMVGSRSIAADGKVENMPFATVLQNIVIGVDSNKEGAIRKAIGNWNKHQVEEERVSTELGSNIGGNVVRFRRGHS